MVGCGNEQCNCAHSEKRRQLFMISHSNKNFKISRSIKHIFLTYMNIHTKYLHLIEPVNTPVLVPARIIVHLRFSNHVPATALAL